MLPAQTDLSRRSAGLGCPTLRGFRRVGNRSGHSYPTSSDQTLNCHSERSGGICISLTMEDCPRGGSGDSRLCSLDGTQAVEKSRYMHRNPITRGLVSSPEQWNWRSYRHYALGEPGPVLVNEAHPAAMTLSAGQGKSPGKSCCCQTPVLKAGKLEGEPAGNRTPHKPRSPSRASTD